MEQLLQPPGIHHWLILTTLLFSIGMYGLLTRRNAVGILICIEIMLNSAAINFVVFNRYLFPGVVDGAIMSIFIIAIAAAEVVVGMAIFVSLYRMKHSVDITKMDVLKH